MSRSDVRPSLLYMDLDQAEYAMASQVHTYLLTPWQRAILYVDSALQKYSMNDWCEPGFCL